LLCGHNWQGRVYRLCINCDVLLVEFMCVKGSSGACLGRNVVMVALHAPDLSRLLFWLILSPAVQPTAADSALTLKHQYEVTCALVCEQLHSTCHFQTINQLMTQPSGTWPGCCEPCTTPTSHPNVVVFPVGVSDRAIVWLHLNCTQCSRRNAECALNSLAGRRDSKMPPQTVLKLVLVSYVLVSWTLPCAVASYAAYLPPLTVDDAALAEQAHPPPDDAQMDKLYDIPALAQKLVAARADAEPPAEVTPLLGPLEIWAKGRRWRKFDSKHTAAVLKELSADEVSALRSLCGRCLYHTLNHDLAAHGNAFEHVFVATGDIDAEWLRDSAVQLAIYLPRIAAHPIIRPVSEGWAVETHAVHCSCQVPCLPAALRLPVTSIMLQQRQQQWYG
jgi:hypothetical protein